MIWKWNNLSAFQAGSKTACKVRKVFSSVAL
jgi:hypothetical protein